MPIENERKFVLEDDGTLEARLMTKPGATRHYLKQAYLDASIQYRIDKYITLYLNGSNLTNEYNRYYLVWPSQEGHANFSERSYTLGARGQW